jgi:PAS domain S-box-containing protein
MTDDEGAGPVEQLLDTPHLADALESDRFKQFLDHIPVAVAVAELHPSERVTYANMEFERLVGVPAAEVEGKPWRAVADGAVAVEGDSTLSQAIGEAEEYIGAFQIERDEKKIVVDAWSNIIQDDQGQAIFRLVALAEVNRSQGDIDAMEKRIKDKDVLLRELQHRVKNNLQMITALIRLETRNLPDDATGERFDRLAGRVEALALLYRSLSDEDADETVDLGVYLSEVATAVMKAHAVEGIRLDLKVDTWPVSINVAMPTGLVVNELLTNALKHAFGPEGGVIKLHSLVDETGCRVTISDNGVGLPEGETWPKAGKLGALIVQSLRQNVGASIDVASAAGEGVRVTMAFARAKAAPEAQ